MKDAAGVEKTIAASAEQLAALKAGDKVKVTLQDGTTTAEKIKKLGKKEAKHKK